nr:hypothetical protein [Providencia rettgeri]
MVWRSKLPGGSPIKKARYSGTFCSGIFGYYDVCCKMLGGLFLD